jgi:hypothetical protein|nr:MAG TPA: hypothetical protein [Caudoviricetes sp.]
MGSRGASSGIAKNGRKYGTEYHSILQVGHIKFVKYNQTSTGKAPMETMRKKRTYVTLGKSNNIRSIDLYTHGKRVAQIDVSGAPHKISGKPTIPHIHLGYFHDEKGGTRKLNDYESELVAKVKRIWHNYH